MALSVNPMAQQLRQVNQAFLETNMWSKSIATLVAFFFYGNGVNGLRWRDGNSGREYNANPDTGSPDTGSPDSPHH